MEWNALFPPEHQPTYENIEEYICGTGRELWSSFFEYMETAYKAKPKMTYSVCSGKPGWNVKFHKSGQSFGTLYPEENSFSVFFVISYKLAPSAEAVLPSLSQKFQELWYRLICFCVICNVTSSFMGDI